MSLLHGKGIAIALLAVLTACGSNDLADAKIDTPAKVENNLLDSKAIIPAYPTTDVSGYTDIEESDLSPDIINAMNSEATVDSETYKNELIALSVKRANASLADLEDKIVTEKKRQAELKAEKKRQRLAKEKRDEAIKEANRLATVASLPKEQNSSKPATHTTATATTASIQNSSQKSKVEPATYSSGKEKVTDTFEVVATSYEAMCDTGCIGITKTGIDVRNKTPRIIAVDPTVIPLHSIVELFVEGKSIGIYQAEDTGGDIKNLRIDILAPTRADAFQFGRRPVTVKILDKTPAEMLASFKKLLNS